jgi:AcrR family transcriptional regulator
MRKDSRPAPPTAASSRKNQTTRRSAAAVSYHHGDLRNAIAQAALQTLQTTGSAVFSLSELARSLNVTPAAVYKHFSDKDALIAELAVQGFAGLAAAFEQAAPQDQAVNTVKQARMRLHHIAAAYHAFGCAHPAVFHLMFGQAGQSYRAAAQQSGRTSGTYGYLVRTLADLHRLGDARVQPTEQHAWLAWCLIHGATELAIAQASTTMRSSQDVGHSVSQSVLALLNWQADGSLTANSERA